VSKYVNPASGAAIDLRAVKTSELIGLLVSDHGISDIIPDSTDMSRKQFEEAVHTAIQDIADEIDRRIPVPKETP
jgi:hypothetical protein